MRALLSRNAFVVNAPDCRGEPPLFAAVRADRVEAAELLLAHEGVDPSWVAPRSSRAESDEADDGVASLARGQRDNEEAGFTALHLAAELGRANLVEALVRVGRVDPDERDVGPKLRTALHRCAARGHVEALETLLAAGADPMIRDADGDLALHLAAVGGCEAVVDVLASIGAGTNEAGACGRAPLHCAVLHGRAGATRALLRAGADVAAIDDGGATPLHWACSLGRTTLLSCLLGRLPASRDDRVARRRAGPTRGAAAPADDPGGNECDSDADAGNSSEEAAEEERRRRVRSARELRRRTSKNRRGGGSGVPRAAVAEPTAMQARAQRRQALRAMRTADAGGSVPLMLACSRGSGAACRMLLEAGADAVARGFRGRTPLHAAAAGGNLEALRMILTRGFASRPALRDAVLNEDDDGLRPAALARQRDQHTAADLLDERFLP
jgi:ankyrin repeat protein